MWNYEKRLQYPINITQPNAKIAQYIMSQYGGPDSNTLEYKNTEKGYNILLSQRSKILWLFLYIIQVKQAF